MFDNDSLELFLEIAGTLTQAELPIVREQGRLGEYAVIYRTYRTKQGGGFGDRSKHPFSWAAIVYIDGVPLRINSARGDRREWSTLDRVATWMVDNGFKYWWTRNDLEVAALPSAEASAESLVDSDEPVNALAGSATLPDPLLE